MAVELSTISSQWFLREPALFSIYCSHRLRENIGIKCPVRAGKGRIEYNPDLLGRYTLKGQEMLLRAELIRILLQHPYNRLPAGCSRAAATVASDMVITSYYEDMKGLFVSPAKYSLPERMHYEWYARQIHESQIGIGSGEGTGKENKSQNKGRKQSDKGVKDGNEDNESREKKCDSLNGGGNNVQADKGKGEGEGDLDGGGGGRGENSDSEALSYCSELWEENPVMREEIIHIVKQTKSWGSIPGMLIEEIFAAAAPKLDYRKTLSGFRASTISSERKLTRMKPNRRTDFENMGQIRPLKTRYLCAVDVSGSISHEDLVRFFSTINRFFKYGVEGIDVITCDTKLSEAIEFKKAKREIHVHGRGGTDFQPVINYLEEHNEYDGLIFFTDGYAPPPEIHKKGLERRILWLLRGKKEYDDGKDWLAKLGRVCCYQE